MRVQNLTCLKATWQILQQTAPKTSAAFAQSAHGPAGNTPQHQAGARPLSADLGRAVSGHDATPRPTQPAEPSGGSTRSTWQGSQREKPLVLGARVTTCLCSGTA